MKTTPVQRASLVLLAVAQFLAIKSLGNSAGGEELASWLLTAVFVGLRQMIVLPLGFWQSMLGFGVAVALLLLAAAATLTVQVPRGIIWVPRTLTGRPRLRKRP